METVTKSPKLIDTNLYLEDIDFTRSIIGFKANAHCLSGYIQAIYIGNDEYVFFPIFFRYNQLDCTHEKPFNHVEMLKFLRTFDEIVLFNGLEEFALELAKTAKYLDSLI